MDSGAAPTDAIGFLAQAVLVWLPWGRAGEDDAEFMA